MNFQALLAFVTVTNDSSTCTLDIETFLQATLPVYMLPRIIIVDNIPFLTNGKTDRQALLKQYESSNLDNGNNICAFLIIYSLLFILLFTLGYENFSTSITFQNY